MSTVIAIWGNQGIGKSSNVLSLANEIMTAYPMHKVIFPSPLSLPLVIDFRLILEVNHKVIAFESMGDPYSALNVRLDEIISLYNPDLLICTCRTKGYTVHDVENAAKKMGADIIWTTPYQANSNRTILNALKAQHLLDLIVKLGLI